MSDQTPIRFHAYVSSFLPVGGKGVLLNAGCGTGRLNQVDLNYEIHNCDLEQRSLPNFKKTDLNERWPYPDNRFDALVSTEVIEHCENPWHFMREVKRVLKPDGIALVTTPNNESDRAKKAFQRTGSFPWFQRQHLYSILNHITPIFSWQMQKICHEMRLKLKAYTWTPQEDMRDDNWVFVITKSWVI